MTKELNIWFPAVDRVAVSLASDRTSTQSFGIPLDASDLKDLRWYVEVYSASSLGDPDEAEGDRIARKLVTVGRKLFQAAFADREARRLYQLFRADTGDRCQITINAEHPLIFSLPWELLSDPSERSGFLADRSHSISICRRASALPARIRESPPKDQLHLLFVVSRPNDAPFMDPRSEVAPVLDALEQSATGRFTWEVLFPPTLDALRMRIKDQTQPAVDIVHFDGHGAYDQYGGLIPPASEEAGNRSPPNMGYLLFEGADETAEFVDGSQLGEALGGREAPAVVLSACQSAMIGSDAEVMGDVATRLALRGVPSVIAMTHSVMVPTTRELFRHFYSELAAGHSIGRALHEARCHLLEFPLKYPSLTGEQVDGRELRDWFVPALYQGFGDSPLLNASTTTQSSQIATRTNLPAANGIALIGRSREVWQAERWFANGIAHVAISGFRGQGKSALTKEIGEWLLRTRMFDVVALVDCANMESADPFDSARSLLGKLIGIDLDSRGSMEEVLDGRKCLLIFDQLEALQLAAFNRLHQECARWSPSRIRVLFTGGGGLRSDPPDPELCNQSHKEMWLAGLEDGDAPRQAAEWLAMLVRTPPASPNLLRNEQPLTALLSGVRFHPASIVAIAQQLSAGRSGNLSVRIDQLLARGHPADHADQRLLDILNYLENCLNEFSAGELGLVRMLGVFEGAAFEPLIVEIIGLTEETWVELRTKLERLTLIDIKSVPDIRHKFITFHPLLAPVLWARLPEQEQFALRLVHAIHYSNVAQVLEGIDFTQPVTARHAILRDLRNFLHGVHSALDYGIPDSTEAATALLRLLLRVHHRAEAEAILDRVGNSPGEEGWHDIQMIRIQLMRQDGHLRQMWAKCVETLRLVGPQLTTQRGLTLLALAESLQALGRPDLAERRAMRAAVTIAAADPDDKARVLGDALLALGDALQHQGRYGEARTYYEQALIHSKQDVRTAAVALGQLGRLAAVEGNWDDAAGRFGNALTIFSMLGDFGNVAVAHESLGAAFEHLGRVDEAEFHYREAAAILERSNAGSASKTWHRLALLCRRNGNVVAAEGWYIRSIQVARRLNQPMELGRALANLADLLMSAGRLDDARRFAEDALSIKEHLDPNATQIWLVYEILARIAELESNQGSVGSGRSSHDYRRRAYEAKRRFAGTPTQMEKYAHLVDAVVSAARGEPNGGALMSAYDREMRRPDKAADWAQLASAIDKLISGERDELVLTELLDLDSIFIMQVVLDRLAEADVI